MSSVCWWLVALVIYAGWVTMLARSMEGLLRTIYANTPTLTRLFGGQDIGTNAGFLAGAVFAFVPVVTVIFAEALALTFATDLDRGRMELVLSTPRSRSRIVLERFSAVCAAAVAAPISRASTNSTRENTRNALSTCDVRARNSARIAGCVYTASPG